jgi:hypothetical protein
MKDTRTDPGNTLPDTSKRLSSPHFDEFAVAVAQPVQLLPPRRKRKLLRSSLFFIAYLAFIVAVAGIAYLKPPGSRDILGEEPANDTHSELQPTQHVGAVATTEAESIVTPGVQRAGRHSSRGLTRIRIPHHTIQIVEGGEGKPAPRKVGEIRYGRSPDRP